MSRQFIMLVLAAASLAIPTPGIAHEQPAHYDRINLSASAGREVETDTLVAMLYKQHQSSDQASAADEVNRAVSWAIAQAKAAQVKVTTSSYRTQALYQKQDLQGWRVQQSIRIESGDAGQLTSLLGVLQKELAIQSLDEELSVEARNAVEKELIAEALQAFQDRAGAIASTLGRSGHRIVDLNISAGGGSPPRTMMRGAMAMESAIAPPAIESGNLRVEVQVNGTIELIAP